MTALKTFLFCSVFFFFHFSASATPLREFLLTSSYGAMAGTVVGAATLAFADRPGDKLQRIARGTSVGLYAGMALGIYIITMVPDGPRYPYDYQIQKEPPPASTFAVLPKVSLKEQTAILHVQWRF